ncbi:perlucin-like [Mercenaria mercenaria]|uniref:perlucin-like n=1 Tax=Mercenaria mercenaria TaxID=6596 RepID=UPI001E1D31A4|nr:perlucin-like [Mercenaria mercenaria]
MDWGKWIILLVATIFETSLGCPTGFLTHGTSCYHFSHDTETWIGALQMCRELDSKLVEINDASENDFIKAKTKLTNKNYWIALSDVREEGSWVWMDSHAALKSTDFSDWSHGQPDNLHNNENCAAMFRLTHHGQWQWSDVPCSSNMHFICELTAREAEVIG